MGISASLSTRAEIVVCATACILLPCPSHPDALQPELTGLRKGGGGGERGAEEALPPGQRAPERWKAASLRKAGGGKRLCSWDGGVTAVHSDPSAFHCDRRPPSCLRLLGVRVPGAACSVWGSPAITRSCPKTEPKQAACGVKLFWKVLCSPGSSP